MCITYFNCFFFKLISQKATCPKYDQMLEKMYTDPPDDLREFVNENAELFTYVSKHTGAVSKWKSAPN